MAKEKRELVKVWFDQLQPVDSSVFGGSRGMTPGGAIFEEGYYYKADLKEKSLILHHSCKVIERENRIEFCFEDDSACGMLRDKVKRIEKVRRTIEREPIRQRDLMIVTFRVPWTDWERARGFLFCNKTLVLGFNDHRSTITLIAKRKKDRTIHVMVFDALVNAKDAKRFILLLFKNELIPPGRIWMTLRHHPTKAEAAGIKRFA